MKQGYFKVIENEKLCENVYKMRLLGDVSGITNAGQFINVKIDRIGAFDLFGKEIK